MGQHAYKFDFRDEIVKANTIRIQCEYKYIDVCRCSLSLGVVRIKEKKAEYPKRAMVERKTEGRVKELSKDASRGNILMEGSIEITFREKIKSHRREWQLKRKRFYNE